MININDVNVTMGLSQSVYREISNIVKSLKSVHIVNKDGGVVFNIWCRDRRDIDDVDRYFKDVYGIDCEFACMKGSRIDYGSKVIKSSELDKAAESLSFGTIAEDIRNNLDGLVDGVIEVKVYRGMTGKYILDIDVESLADVRFFKDIFKARYGIKKKDVIMIKGDVCGDRFIVRFDKFEDICKIDMVCRLCEV